MARLLDCTCIHTPKKHKASGRCRGKWLEPSGVVPTGDPWAYRCLCNAAKLKADRKRREGRR